MSARQNLHSLLREELWCTDTVSKNTAAVGDKQTQIAKKGRRTIMSSNSEDWYPHHRDDP